uniref:Guanylate kinase-like domain-containing protein n=1 Tax=Esox lucius TaxID=8010 RepID=A0A3P8Z8Z2_ESOLU
MSTCLSKLGRSATGLEYIYQFLSVPVRSLIRLFSLRCNKKTFLLIFYQCLYSSNLSCVSHMPYLIILDASHNQITDFFGFKPPKNLKEVNLSHNQMSVMTNLSECSSLSILKLDYNCFSEIRGLEHCASLSHLSLAHNKISHISGLDNLPLKELCLRGNRIETIENMDTLRTLQVLDLSLNRISSLFGLQNLCLLGSINLESNQVSATNKYDPSMEVVAARDHMTHMVYQLMQPQVIYDSTLPSLDTPYPMLVLTGPQACGKRELAHKLCQDFSHFFAYGACHTTRGPYFGEEDGSDYHFVTEEDFQNMINMGQFIQTVQYQGHWYGLSRAAIENAARQGLACCLHMELEGAFRLKNTHFEPRYVLLLPTDKEWYAGRLMARGLYTHPQIDTALARVDTYARVNGERPGFFDRVIPCDDLVKAYKTLRHVLMEYLGEEELDGVDRSNTATPDNISTGQCLLPQPPQTTSPQVSVYYHSHPRQHLHKSVSTTTATPDNISTSQCLLPQPPQTASPQVSVYYHSHPRQHLHKSVSTTTATPDNISTGQCPCVWAVILSVVTTVKVW